MERHLQQYTYYLQKVNKKNENIATFINRHTLCISEYAPNFHATFISPFCEYTQKNYQKKKSGCVTFSLSGEKRIHSIFNSPLKYFIFSILHSPLKYFIFLDSHVRNIKGISYQILDSLLDLI